MLAHYYSNKITDEGTSVTPVSRDKPVMSRDNNRNVTGQEELCDRCKTIIRKKEAARKRKQRAH